MIAQNYMDCTAVTVIGGRVARWCGQWEFPSTTMMWHQWSEMGACGENGDFVWVYDTLEPQSNLNYEKADNLSTVDKQLVTNLATV